MKTNVHSQIGKRTNEVHRAFREGLEDLGATCYLQMAHDFSTDTMGDYAYSLNGTRVDVSVNRGLIEVDSRNGPDRKKVRRLVGEYFPQ